MEYLPPLCKKICFLIFAIIFKQNLNVDAKNSGTVAFANVTTTKYGPVGGKLIQLATEKTISAYFGIPYATAMRFESPRPPKKWEKILNTTSYSYGRTCPGASEQFKEKLLSERKEDCLFLNVYVPSEALDESLPVFVWFENGLGKSDETWHDHDDVDRSYVAAEGRFVIVTVKYRLGILGYLTTGDDQIKGNFGSMDQVQALRWVRENIVNFGGDPEDVTLFGVSHGAVSVSLLMLSPLTTGLYRNVVLQSGTAIAPFSTLDKETAVQTAMKVGRVLNCTELSSLRSCLRAKSVEDLVAAQNKLTRNWLIPRFAAIVDGHFLLDSPVHLLRKGEFNRNTSVVIGLNREDGSVFTGKTLEGCSTAVKSPDNSCWNAFIGAVKKIQWIKNQNNKVEEAVIYEYGNWENINDGNGTGQSLVSAVTDAAFRVPAILSAQYFVQHGLETFFYQADYVTPLWPGSSLGNEDELMAGGERSTTNDGLYTNFTKDTIRLWASFVHSSNPSTSTIFWPRYTIESEQYLVPRLSTFKIKSGLIKKRRVFWNRLVPSLVDAGSPTTAATTLYPATPTSKVKENQGLVAGVTVLSLLVIVMGAIIIWQCRRKRTKKSKHSPQ